MTRAGTGYWNRTWYERSPLGWAWLPLSWLYAGVTGLRRAAYGAGLFRSHAACLPVVVVGNLTVGGTGKTPVVIWLANALAARGIRVGVVSRGYGGKPGPNPLTVDASTSTALAGDEPVLIARRSTAKVVVHPDRVRAAAHFDLRSVDVILSDDGLQHYRLRRDFEIAVVDGQRGFGNGRLLPAGPLREPLSRLRHVNRVLTNGQAAVDWSSISGGPPVTPFDLKVASFVSLSDGQRVEPDAFSGRTVHGVAGIGNPERFFAALRSLGVTVVPHPLPDHATPEAVCEDFDDELPVVMTEKDAVKCAGAGDRWFLEVDVEIDDAGLVDEIVSLVKRDMQS